MRKRRAAVLAMFLAGCGLDIVGAATTESPDASTPGPEASVEAATSNDAEADVETADVAVEASSDAALDASLDAREDASDAADAADAFDAADGNPCAACPLSAADTLCVKNKCTAVRRVFATSATFTGNLGGLNGADSSCQNAATAAGLGGNWKAWLSSSTSSVKTRLTFGPANTPYVLLDGTQIASDATQLFLGPGNAQLDHDIDIDENGHASTGDDDVWTGTTQTGASDNDTDPTPNAPNNYCVDWTSNSGSATAEVGHFNARNADYTAVYLQFCNEQPHLYCFEQ